VFQGVYPFPFQGVGLIPTGFVPFRYFPLEVATTGIALEMDQTRTATLIVFRENPQDQALFVA
jgi:hypothetical protein